jgi:RNA polymerase sigma factor (sigma-70 family)
LRIATATVESQEGATAMDTAADEGDWTPPTWEAIVRDHSARVYRLAFRLTGNRHDAEDLTQEVFVRVFKSLPTFRPGTLEGWMHRITTNLFLDQARRRRRIRFDALPLDFGDKMPGLTPSPDTEVARDLFDPDIEAALAELPPEYRAAVVLCDVEGLSYEEIAQALDVKIGTVRSRIHRGRSMLRKSLMHRAPTVSRTRHRGPLDAALGGDVDTAASGIG